jgi:hypothetical protein
VPCEILTKWASWALFSAKSLRVSAPLRCGSPTSESALNQLINSRIHQFFCYSSCVEAISTIRHRVGDHNRPILSRGSAAWLFAMLAAVFLVSLLYHAPDGNYFTVCGFKTLTGLPCPGCGLAHSFCSLAKGQIWKAFSYNALGPGLFVLSIALWVRSGLVLLGKNGIALGFDRLMGRIRLARGVLIAFVVFGVGRILYLMVTQPSVLNNGYLAKLMTLLGH